MPRTQGLDRAPQRSRRAERGRRRRWSLTTRILSATLGILIAGSAAYAATSWVVGLNAGSNAEGKSATVANLSITAISSPAPTNLLYPGSTGDVVAQITNSNAFPVTITAVNLPASTTYGAGYSNAALTTAQSGCDATTSTVGWNFSTSTSGSSHTLATPLTIAASGTLTVTFTNDAAMGTGSPAACENTYFSMPSLTGVGASAGQATATTSPATDAWTS